MIRWTKNWLDQTVHDSVNENLPIQLTVHSSLGMVSPRLEFTLHVSVNEMCRYNSPHDSLDMKSPRLEFTLRDPVNEDLSLHLTVCDSLDMESPRLEFSLPTTRWTKNCVDADLSLRHRPIISIAGEQSCFEKVCFILQGSDKESPQKTSLCISRWPKICLDYKPKLRSRWTKKYLPRRNFTWLGRQRYLFIRSRKNKTKTSFLYKFFMCTLHDLKRAVPIKHSIFLQWVSLLIVSAGNRVWQN